MNIEQDSPYAWFIVGLAALTNLFGVGVPLMCMPVLFKAISMDLNLSLVQIGMAWGIGSVASMITNPFGGIISDRFGVKNVLVVYCMIVGLTGAARGLATNYATFMLAMFAVGLVQNTIVLTVHKCTGVWFTGQRVVVANGIVSAGIALGMFLGAMVSETWISPLLGGWRNTLFAYGAITFFMGIIWALTRKEPPIEDKKESTDARAFRQSVTQVLRTRNVWIFSIVHLCVIGSIMGVIGYLPLYLRSTGWTPATADGALAALNAAGMLTAIPIALISGKLGIRQGILLPLLIIAAVCAGLIPFVSGWIVFMVVILFGLLRDGYFALLATMVIETRSIGPAFAGTAIGVIYSLGNIGVFTSSAVGNRIASVNSNAAFLVWASMLLVAFIALRFTRSRN